MNKLRRLYDWLYIRTEVVLHAWSARRSARKYAKHMTENPRVAEEYHTSIRAYWKQFGLPAPRRYWFRLLCNDQNPFHPGYIPDDRWFRDVVPHYNNLLFAKALQDKCLHSVLFPEMKRPETVVKNIAGVFYTDDLTLLTREQAAARCHNVGRVIVKPSVGSGQGHGIRFFDTDTLTDDDLFEIFGKYGKDFIIQKKMPQHPTLAAPNPNSLNTVRVITFLHDDKVQVLTAILRVGGGGNEVDNTSQGGYKASIRPDGHLHPVGMSKIGGWWAYTDHYPGGLRFEDVVIPSWERIVETVTAAAAKMAHFKIIGWDIAVDPEGEPVLIEFNVIPAQGHGTSGPLFGDMTETVLAEVYGRKKGT